MNTGSQLFKLTPSDTRDERFGLSVAISGDTAIVAAKLEGDHHLNTWARKAYLFDVNTGQQLFMFTDPNVSDGSCGCNEFSVDISGNTAILGAQYDDDAGERAGATYLFDVTTGEQISKLTAVDAAENDLFGFSVGISGNTAIVGAIFNDDAGRSSGAAYLFTTSQLAADLTNNGFVDFEDLTVLLANWNKQVGAEAGNLVNPTTTPVNFDDLTVLLADWTGPGPAASPAGALGAEAVPEPSTWALALVAALVGLPVLRRRRRAHVTSPFGRGRGLSRGRGFCGDG